MLSRNHLPNQGNSVWTHDTPPEAKSQTVEVVVERLSDDGEIDERLVYEVTGYECFGIEIEEVRCIGCGQPGSCRAASKVLWRDGMTRVQAIAHLKGVFATLELA